MAKTLYDKIWESHLVRDSKEETPIKEDAVDFLVAHGITSETLTAWCRDNMATYKVPEIRIVPALPMTATGKVMKEELRKELA